ncbi:MAG: hypothetical protein KDD44_13810, partial [Bdellovibrionales bacterium]|nr:hypothetical protein [Bdellovibrionales bacterium]
MRIRVMLRMGSVLLGCWALVAATCAAQDLKPNPSGFFGNLDVRSPLVARDPSVPQATGSSKSPPPPTPEASYRRARLSDEVNALAPDARPDRATAAHLPTSGATGAREIEERSSAAVLRHVSARMGTLHELLGATSTSQPLAVRASDAATLAHTTRANATAHQSHYRVEHVRVFISAKHQASLLAQLRAISTLRRREGVPIREVIILSHEEISNRQRMLARQGDVTPKARALLRKHRSNELEPLEVHHQPQELTLMDELGLEAVDVVTAESLPPDDENLPVWEVNTADGETLP